MTRPVRFLSLMFYLLFACSALALADDANPGEFKKAKPKLQTLLRSRQASDRVTALRKLKDYHEIDAAKLVVQLGLADRSRDVRVATYETLSAYQNDTTVAPFLLSSLKREAKSKNGGQGTDILLAVLLASTDETTREGVDQLLDKTLANPAGVQLAAAAADTLGQHGEKSDLAPLLRLVDRPVFKDSFAVRRATVMALMHIREPEVVEHLIELLEKLDGEVRGDIAAYLCAISKQDFELNAMRWKAWWKEAQDGFKFPGAPQNWGMLPRPVRAGAGQYYGLPLYATKLVFVLDTSGSMAGPRLLAAKRELIQAIEKLPEEDSFGLVVFNSRVDAWQKQLVPANSANKAAATRYVMALVVQDKTASFDAISAAFNFDAEAIYFVSDGAPTAGRIVNPVDILAAVGQGNLARRVSIYSVGIGAGPEGGPFDVFLSELASQNYGEYRRVDQ